LAPPPPPPPAPPKAKKRCPKGKKRVHGKCKRVKPHKKVVLKRPPFTG
jgi:hypothetical protein